MKRTALFAVLMLLVGVNVGCVKNSATLNPSVAKDLTVLTLDGNLKGQTADQKRELDHVIRWMDRDLVKNLKKSGFNAVLIKDRKSYNAQMGKLLIVDVDNFNAGNRAARAFVGFGAGASSLDLSYQLLNETGGQISAWKDGVGSSKGGTYCAQTLNRKAVARVIELLNK